MGRPPVIKRNIGETEGGAIYVVKHECSGCDALVTTTGAAHPVMICSKCGYRMGATRVLAGGA